MKDIIGHTSYKEISPEDLTRALHEAEILRAESVRDHFFALGRLISRTTSGIREFFGGLVHHKPADVH
ncbi:MAG: hypothetical protein CMM61_09915 [Rhodospirillaceae bacterium]|nr:hypothetical protein [Rhodospirillaceae bacterium]|tara:strand:+ start:681 stop:884 length:204 start_codon:yes stop_codon:yes gene_type:complete